MDEIAYIDGQSYKVGLHNNVFVWRNEEWRLTKNISADKVRLYIEKRPKNNNIGE